MALPQPADFRSRYPGIFCNVANGLALFHAIDHRLIIMVDNLAGRPMGHRVIIGVIVKLERLHIVTESPPAFFKMDFKNRALSRGIIL
ncbi:MAG: hypothetical protein AAFW83_14770 [Pseudomonadota bacterium]